MNDGKLKIIEVKVAKLEQLKNQGKTKKSSFSPMDAENIYSFTPRLRIIELGNENSSKEVKKSVGKTPDNKNR